MDNKIRDLLQAAIDKTGRDELSWTAFDSDSFRAKIGPGYLHIQRGSIQVSPDGVDFYPAVTYSVQISDAQGRVVAEAETREMREDFGLFGQLFEAARKAALGSDRVIDDMLHTLRGSRR
jgi:hypothetical protein